MRDMYGRLDAPFDADRKSAIARTTWLSADAPLTPASAREAAARYASMNWQSVSNVGGTRTWHASNRLPCACRPPSRVRLF
jgi:hypothetical protein